MKTPYSITLALIAFTLAINSQAQITSANGIFNASSTTAPLVLQTNGTTRLTIINTGTNAGNVAIGTADPKGYRLAVAGKVVAEEVVIKLLANWPDYVFDTNYKMPTLLELETYIMLNHHLPEVPSAEDVKKDGVALGDMNAILLKKIEELTLYVIELKKENEEIKKRINEKQ